MTGKLSKLEHFETDEKVDIFPKISGSYSEVTHLD